MNEVVAKISSKHLQNERTVWIRAPRDSSSAKNLTIFLDGELYRDRVGAISVLDGLEQVEDSWFVFVSMHSVDARWVECPCYPPFAAFVADELLSWLQRRFPSIALVTQRVLAGLSYTGLAAAFVARQYPGVFHRIISQSGSFWSDDCWLVKQYSDSAPLPTQFYLDVGTRETQEQVRHREDVLQVISQIEGVRRFRDTLLTRGHVVRYVEFDGGHEFAAWRTTLPGALQWALCGGGT